MADRFRDLLHRVHRIVHDVFHRIDGLLERTFHPLGEKITLAGFHQLADRLDFHNPLAHLRNSGGFKNAEVRIDLEVSHEPVRNHLVPHAVGRPVKKIRRKQIRRAQQHSLLEHRNSSALGGGKPDDKRGHEGENQRSFHGCGDLIFSRRLCLVCELSSIFPGRGRCRNWLVNPKLDRD